jgi:hypothetical protein
MRHELLCCAEVGPEDAWTPPPARGSAITSALTPVNGAVAEPPPKSTPRRRQRARYDHIAQRYPRMAAYLKGLPEGEDSYPRCQVRTSLCVTQLNGMPIPHPAAASVPEPAARLLAGPLPTTWMPEVELMAMVHFIADHYQMDEPTQMRWMQEQNAKFYRTSMYSAAAMAVTPEFLIGQFSPRWAEVHRGSEITARLISPKEGELVLRFPPLLFDTRLLHLHGWAFENGIQHFNMPDAKVWLTDHDSVRGCYKIAFP